MKTNLFWLARDIVLTARSFIERVVKEKITASHLQCRVKTVTVLREECRSHHGGWMVKRGRGLIRAANNDSFYH